MVIKWINMQKNKETKKNAWDDYNPNKHKIKV